MTLRHVPLPLVVLFGCCSVATATENGIYIWHVGAESYGSGFGTSFHRTQLYEYRNRSFAA